MRAGCSLPLLGLPPPFSLPPYSQPSLPACPSPALHCLPLIRVYQEEGFDIDPKDLAPIIGTAWQQLTNEERQGYEHRSRQELQSYQVRRGRGRGGGLAYAHWEEGVHCVCPRLVAAPPLACL